MATWDPTLPQGTTKIRLEPTILQQRWVNIQQGEVPSTKWQLARRAGNPGAIPNAGLIFTKDGGSGWSELFYKDDQGTAKTTQLTTDGGVGGLTQKLYGNNVTMKPGATEINNPQQAFCCAYGFFSSQTVNGVYAPDAGSYNMTSYQRIGTGKYIVTMNFTSTGTGLTYVPNVTVRKLGSSQMWTAFIQDQTTTTFRIHIFETNGIGSGVGGSQVNFSDADFCVTVFGAFT